MSTHVAPIAHSAGGVTGSGATKYPVPNPLSGATLDAPFAALSETIILTPDANDKPSVTRPRTT